MAILDLIHFKKRYVLSLYKRLYMIRNDFAEKSDYEKNEIEIIEFQTKSAIVRANHTIFKMEYDLSVAVEIICGKSI